MIDLRFHSWYRSALDRLRKSGESIMAVMVQEGEIRSVNQIKVDPPLTVRLGDLVEFNVTGEVSRNGVITRSKLKLPQQPEGREVER